MERVDQREPACIGQPAIVDQAQQGRDDHPDDEAQENRDIAEEAADELVDENDRNEHQERHSEIDRFAELRIADPAGRPVDADLDKRQADDRDDAAGDDGREKEKNTAHQGRHNDGEHASGDGGAENAEGTKLRILGHGHHRRHRGKGHPHDDGQADAEFPGTNTLKEGGDA